MKDNQELKPSRARLRAWVLIGIVLLFNSAAIGAVRQSGLFA